MKTSTNSQSHMRSLPCAPAPLDATAPQAFSGSVFPARECAIRRFPGVGIQPGARRGIRAIETTSSRAVRVAAASRMEIPPDCLPLRCGVAAMPLEPYVTAA